MDWKNISKSITLEQKFQDVKNDINTQLLEACALNNIRAALKAIKDGAFVDCNDGLYTPLMLCVENDFFDMARLLITFNAEPTAQVKNRDAVLLAVNKKGYNFLELFFERKMRLNRDENGQTMLMRAVIMGDFPLVKIIGPKVNVNEKDPEGNTALLHCLMKISPTKDDVEIGRFLIALGADTRTRNLEGNNAEKLALSQEARVVLQEQQIKESVTPKGPKQGNGNFKNNNNKQGFQKSKKMRI